MTAYSSISVHVFFFCFFFLYNAQTRVPLPDHHIIIQCYVVVIILLSVLLSVYKDQSMLVLEVHSQSRLI